MRFVHVLSGSVEAALAGEVVSPDVIGVNFAAGVHPIGHPSDGLAFWNNLDGGDGADVQLMDATGRPTDARLTFESAGVYAGFGRPKTLNRTVNTLYSGGLVGNPTASEVRIAVSGIPYARWDVFVFASADTRDHSTLSITDGRTTFYYCSTGRDNAGCRRLLRTKSQDPHAPTAGPAQYQVFEGSGESFAVVTGGSMDCVLSNNVFGLLIVRAEWPPDSEPDPAM